MSVELKPYPAYKHSGLPWLGRIPEHWQATPLRAILSERREVNTSREVSQVLSVMRDIGVIPYEEKGDVGNKRSEDISRYKIVRPNDIVMNSMNVIIGSVGLSRYTGCLSPVYYVLTTRQLRDHEPRYYDYTFKCKPFQRSLVRIGNGILAHRMRIPMEMLKQELLPIPPLPEQQAIVRFLDSKLAEIDRLIEGKRKLIELLNEQKAVIINQAVTRGIDPNVRLKPSGIEWIGDIPEHWEVLRLRNVVQLLVSNVDKHTKENEIPVRLCNYVDVYKNERITDHLAFMSASASWGEMQRFRLQAGDVVITKDSEMWNDIGVPALVEYQAPDLLCGYHLAILRPCNALLGTFLFRALQSPLITVQFHLSANGITRYGLAHQAIKDVYVPIPSRAEQSSIIRFLDDATAHIDTTIDRAHHEISLLHEYRTTLISDVVTGKVDVRGAIAGMEA